MKPASDRNPRIIRMFPDYADSVLWVDGPVDYSETGLSAGLVEGLQAWEQSFYDALNGDYAFRSRALEEKLTLEGIRLAKLVAAEIGSGHVVEYTDAAMLKHAVLFRCPGNASNPAAARRFDDLVEAKLRVARQMQEALKEGPFYAYAPLSGTVFDPQGVLTGHGKARKRRDKHGK
ncbi:hypothetical protein ACSYDW_07755 [Paeniglutamicibacter sp. R2-26]|uniref:hypothetical protein n=1 Tax=Paeniglutamicibacter sp. R2-26 TaxID=3144417 RepID=UPI003EE633FF